MPTLIDDSVADLETITVSAGQRGLSIALSPTGLAELTNATFAPIGTE